MTPLAGPASVVAKSEGGADTVTLSVATLEIRPFSSLTV